MTILHPALLGVGLGLVAVPILIHILMRRRRKPVPWGAMRFLLEAYKTQRRRMTLEQMLLLAARCLLVALLALAIARPMLGGGTGAGSNARTLVILLDNSITSDLSEDGQTSLERHRAIATQALQRLDQARGDRAALITLAGPARAVALPATADIAGVMRAIENTEPTDSGPDYLGAAETLASVLGARDENAPPVSVLLASDFRAGQGVGRAPLPALGESVEALLVTSPPPPGAGNIAIESLEPMRSLVVSSGASGALGTGQARVALRRSGSAIGQRGVTSVRLVSDLDPSLTLGQDQVRWSEGQSEGEALVTIDSEALTRAQYAGSPLVLRAEIDPDGLGRDNARRRALEVRESISVGIASPGRYAGSVGIEGYTPSDWLRLALSPGENSGLGGISLEQVEPGVIDETRLARLDALLLPRPDLIDDGAWERIASFARSGGLVVAFPPGDEGAQLWTDRLTRSLGLRLDIEREARRYASPLGVRPGDDTPLLSLIAGELEFLAQPVRVQRLLPVGVEPQGGASVILAVEDGAPLVVASPPAGDAGRGLVVLFASAIDTQWSDLPTKPLLVPLLQEIVRQGVGRARGTYGGIAGARVLAPTGSVELTPVTNSGASISLDETGLTRDPLRSGGAWRAIDQRGVTKAAVVVNPDTSATLADPEDPARVQRWLATLAPETEPTWIGAGDAIEGASSVQSVAQAIDAPRRGVEYAWIVFAAALGLGLVEVFLARLCSHADLRDIASPVPPKGGA